jgi:tetratricopeptide (TPR) repeat protein
MAELAESESGAEPQQALDTGSAAVAVALQYGRGGRTPKSVDRFLARQEELIAKQLHHLDAQFSTMQLDHWSKRLRLGLQALTMLAGVLILGAVGWLAWRAHEANGVVIEAFSTPPDMASKGYSGQALANRIEDRLNELQAETLDARPAATYSNNWGHDIKVEIPETGVSLSDVDRMLREWLGHEAHVGGDLVRTPQGLSLTIRSEAGGTEVTGDEADMSALVQNAAEALYGRTQPYRYGAYLSGKKRVDEARAVWTKLADEGAPEERAWALAGLARIEADPRVGAARAREALALDPKLAAAWVALAGRLQESGDIPASGAAAAKAIALIQGKGHGGYSDATVVTSHGVAAVLDTFSSRYADCANETRSALPLAHDSRLRIGLEQNLGFCLAHIHEIAAARAAQHDIPDAELIPTLPDGLLTVTYIQAAYMNEDWPALLQQAKAVETLLLQSQSPGARSFASGARGMQSVALLAMGRIAEGKALVEALPADCPSVDCDGYRAFLKEMTGDYAGADHMRMASAHSLNIPYAYNDWGRLRLRHGDNDGAIAVFAEGTRAGARFADNWQGWGEALLNKGDAQGAVGKFQEAQKTAPRWARLHVKWGEALMKLGRRDEARAQVHAAATMDLTPTERTELAALKL